jgi:AraC-like DNA-binding protein
MQAPGGGFDYRTRVPSASLRPMVELLWYARGTIGYRRERIAPTGSTVALIVLGDPIIERADDGRGPETVSDLGLLIGPHDRPIVNEPTGETHALGIVCTPVGCEATLGVAPGRIRGRVVTLGDHWAGAAELRDRLLDVDDPERMLELVEANLTAAAAPMSPRLERTARAVTLLEADPTTPVATIAALVGVSHGYLDRLFRRTVGMGPRALARLLRVRRLLEAIDVRSGVDWADQAAALGWADQAHLIRDFRRHTGVTPTRYVRAQLASLARGEDLAQAAGFVTDPPP